MKGWFFLHITVYDITEAFPLVPIEPLGWRVFLENRIFDWSPDFQQIEKKTHSIAIRFSLSYIYFIHAVSHITFETNEKK
jgi:hypothetical protein